MIITTEQLIEMYTKYENQGMSDTMDILGKMLVELEFTDVETEIIHIMAIGETVKEYVASTYEEGAGG